MQRHLTFPLQLLIPLLILTALCMPPPAAVGQEVPLTPRIGVDPDVLDFGIMTLGDCSVIGTDLFNDGEPGSLLEINDLTASGNAMTLYYPPSTPFTIPTGGAVVPVRVRACALTAGQATGTLIIESHNAANSPFEVPILIFGNRPPICDAGGPYTVEIGSSITFDGTGSHDVDGTVDAYAWEFGDGDLGVGATTEHTYGAPGLYVVTLCVSDNHGAESCCTTTADIDPGPPPPICEAGGPYVGIIHQPVPFDGTGSSAPAGSIVSYAWEFGDGATGSSATPQHVYTFGGPYLATLCVTDDLGTESCCATDVDIDSTVPPICDAGGPYSGNIGQAILFDGTGSSDPDGMIVAYAWSFGDGGQGVGATSTHAYTNPNLYTVTLCVTDDEGGESCCVTDATAHQQGGSNQYTGLVMHAVQTGFGPCNIPDPCVYGTPTVNVPAGTAIAAYLIVRNYSEIAGVQTAFDFGGFTLLFGLWDCQSNQVSGHTPMTPGGPTDGTISTAFDCISGGSSQVIGRLHMLPLSGCLTQVESSFPFGTHVVDSVGAVTSILEWYRGSICVDSGGLNVCEPVIPVEDTTWGSIKARFR